MESGARDSRGQLAPSGVPDAVLPSGQQPNSSLSHDDLTSAEGTAVLISVVSGGGGETQGGGAGLTRDS